LKKFIISTVFLFSFLLADYSLHFDGDSDRVEIPKLFSGIHSDFTINMWIKAPLQGHGPIFQHQAAYGDVVGAIQNGNFLFRIYEGQGNQNNTEITVDFTPYEDTWTHISLVNENTGGNNNEQKLYINGHLVANALWSGNKDWDYGYVMTGIGGHHNYDNTINPDTFEGFIGRFETWNYSLSQEEIISSMSADLSSDENGCK